MTMQPTPPPAPRVEGLSAQDRADLAQNIRQANAEAQQIRRDVAQTVAQTNREFAQTSAGPSPGVIKDATGRITVTGADGRTISIPPSSGLRPDQIQDLVQSALQPTPPQLRRGSGIPGELIPLAAIIFPCLVIMVTMIMRTFAGRRTATGPVVAALPPEAAARLARIEQAVEAVAIEVERISEAQRYSAQLLTDRLPGAAMTAPAIAASRGGHG